MDIIDAYRAFHPKAAEYTFFSSACETFCGIDHMLGHKGSLDKCNKTENISNIFFDRDDMTLEINYKKKKVVKATNTCRLSNMLLNN